MHHSCLRNCWCHFKSRCYSFCLFVNSCKFIFSRFTQFFQICNTRIYFFNCLNYIDCSAQKLPSYLNYSVQQATKIDNANKKIKILQNVIKQIAYFFVFNILPLCVYLCEILQLALSSIYHSKNSRQRVLIGKEGLDRSQPSNSPSPLIKTLSSNMN